MVAWEKHIKIWQLLGAVLAIPAGIAGTYGVYENYVSGGVSCPELKTSIVATLEKSLAPDTKRVLLHDAVAQFDKRCGQKDPDTQIVFDAAMAPPTTAAAKRNDNQIEKPGVIFGLSRTGEKRGWVPLLRRESNQDEDPNFDSGGFPISPKSPPGIGATLMARRLIPVWLEPHMGPDQSLLQGRLASGECVKILNIRTASARLWAEVTPEACR
jgi:hypothetical protein